MSRQIRFRLPSAVLIAVGLTLGLVFAVPASIASAESPDEVEARNLDIVRAGLDAWRDGTGSPYDALADDAMWEITGNSLASRTYISEEDFLANVIRPFNARMSAPLVPMVRDLYADGDTVVAFFDAEGTARDGLPYRNTYSWFLTMPENRIVKASAFFDSIAFNDLWTRVSP